MLKLLTVLCVSLSIANSSVMHPPIPEALQGRASAEEYSQTYWTKVAEEIVKAHADKINVKKAKNVILFIGDGMGIQTVTAARMLLGDENKSLSFEKFPAAGSVKTYCLDAQIADSACTATAYLTGVKNNIGVVGINGRVTLSDCEGANDETSYTDSIAKWAQTANKSTGLVTTTRVTHASPSGVYAHSPNRNWESDYCIPYNNCGVDEEENMTGCSASKIDDIAKQLVRGEVGSNLNVILGGGSREFFDNSVRDEMSVQGMRRDGLDLISEWRLDGKRNKQVVKTRAQLMAVDTSKTDYLMGLFGQGSHMKFFLEGDRTEPTLWEMTEKALQVLSKNENGFFLFVEGGRIDDAHHNNQARYALSEAVQFSEAIEKTGAMFSEEDTLIVVSADHSHVMSISGYPVSGVGISFYTMLFIISLYRDAVTTSSVSPELVYWDWWKMN